MGKIYSKPIMALELFTPEECVAACSITCYALPFDTNYVRVDLNGNHQFDATYSGSTLTYTERHEAGHHIFGGGKVTLEEGQWWYEDVDVYKIDPSQSNITRNEENGHSYYDTSLYTKVASRLIKSKWGWYYLADNEGQSVITKNAS